MTDVICRHCGARATEDNPVEMQLGYLGGRGYGELGPYCRDVAVCWGRVDAGARGPAWSGYGIIKQSPLVSDGGP